MLTKHKREVQDIVCFSALRKRPDLKEQIIDADLDTLFPWMQKESDERWHTKIGDLSDQLIAAIEHAALPPEHGHL